MSLILEALRKSEAERQLGRPPGLLSPAPAVASRRAMRWWVAPAVLLLFAVGLGSWWLGRQGAAPDTAAPSTATPAAPDSTSAATQAAPPAPPPIAVPTPRPAASAATMPTAPTPRAPESTTPEPRPAAAPPKPAPSTAPRPSSTATSPKAPAPPADVSEADEQRIPLARIEHMPSADRARLPALKLSVHLFAEQSDRRFAIIDGRRVTDDDKLADDLAVEAIVPEGVLLVFEGRTWLLPRP